jgi:hypothetical protein
MLVERFEFSLDRLEGRVSECDVDSSVGITPHCRLNRTIRPDDMSIDAMDDGVIGRIVGHLKDGTPTFRALYFEVDGSF